VPGKWISSGGLLPKREARSRKPARSTLDLVRDGVRRFILNDASLGDFRKAIRAAARKGELSPPSMTGTAFRKIVRQAIAERKRKTSPAPGRNDVVSSKPKGSLPDDQ
jgi:DNA-binding NarL/FixJ family response regulator